MLKDKAREIAEQTKEVRDALAAAIETQTPADLALFSVIKFSELDNSILSAEHYNTGSQLRKLLKYVSGDEMRWVVGGDGVRRHILVKGVVDRSLGAIVNTFTSIVETGKAPAFDGLIFNATARGIVAGLL